QREVAQLVAAEAEFAVHSAWPAGEGAAVAQAHRRRVARQLLELVAGGFLRLVGGARVLHDLAQRSALRLEFLHHFLALIVTQRQCELGHACPQCLNGKRNAASSARASSSVFAVVVIAMFIPRSASILSYSISGKMICSLKPRL